MAKTPTALNVVKDKFDLVIIICPASLLLQWKGEVERWIGTDATIYVSKGTKAQRSKLYESLLIQNPYGKHLDKNTTMQQQEKQQNQWIKKFVIISYETLRNDLLNVLNVVDSFTKMNCTTACIVDEAHRLANHKSLQSKALYELGKHAHTRLALTGTPAMNHPSDLFGIFRFLRPERFTSYWQFVERYFHIDDGYFGKQVGSYKRKEELQHIMDLMSVQRKRKDVMQWLPDKQYQTVELEGSTKQMKAYKSVLETFVYEDEDSGAEIDASSILAQLTRLRQITLAPEVLGIEAKSSKEEWILNFIADNPNEHIIIFSSFTSYLKLLHEKLKGKAVSIHGEMSADEKQAAANTFQEGKKETNVLLSNIKAGGTGWTLDKATTTIFLDRHYNPTLNEQAEDRMVSTQEGDTSGSLVIDLVLKDTVDEKIMELLKDKTNIIKYVNDYGLSKLLNS